jgi:SAM-dependent methyltransferase
MAALKTYLKKVIPDSVLMSRERYIERKRREEFQRCAMPRDTFSRVYECGYWGQSKERGERYYSGPGSHMDEYVDSYISAVSGFLQSFGEKPDVVDLGCGDFAIGSRIRPYCGNFIAVDVVEGLIERNKKRYANDSVDFRVLDIINDDLPKGDVVFLRQVLQHLSNCEIEKVAARLPAKYRFLILTEHLPMSGSFVPNVDIMRGPDIRLTIGEEGSGVILTEPPFNMKVAKSTLLCEVLNEGSEPKSVVRTNLYEF